MSTNRMEGRELARTNLLALRERLYEVEHAVAAAEATRICAEKDYEDAKQFWEDYFADDADFWNPDDWDDEKEFKRVFGDIKGPNLASCRKEILCWEELKNTGYNTLQSINSSINVAQAEYHKAVIDSIVGLHRQNLSLH